MHDLEITWPMGRARFTPSDSPVHVGRSPDAGVVLTDPSVSRRHIEFVWTGTAWTASDSSTHGSFDPIGVRLAPTWTVGTNTTVRLGGIEGVELRIELVTTRPAVEPPPGPPPAPPEVAPPRPPSLQDFSSPVPPAAPAPRDLAAAGGPSLFNAPSAFDAPPAPPAGPSTFDAPPAPPAGGPSAFDAPPAPPAGPSAFDAPPAPPAGPSAFDAPPPPAAPSGYIAPSPGPAAPPAPAPPPSVLEGHNGPPAGYSPAPSEQWAAAAPPSAGPAAGWNGHGGADGGWAPDAGPAATSLHHLASATVVSDATISLSIDGRDFTFLPGTEITVGRDPGCLVTVDERHSLVSRRHLTITHRDDHWWMEDTSTKGTYVDGRRISGPVKAEGAFLAQLGDDDAGVSLKIITAGDHKIRRQQNIPLLVAIGVLALVAVGALILALQTRGGQQAVSAGQPATTAASGDQAAADLARAKQSTVMLLAEEGVGSGFFVTDNLIVTNQHVAALDETLLVAVSRDVDEPAVVEYEAETVALHPFLDIAVMKLTVDANGDTVDSANLPSVTIGDSAQLTLGDAVYNTGFPAEFSPISLDDMGLLRLPPVSATRGEAANFAIWPGCSNPDQASFIPEGSPPGVVCSPDGDLARAVVITTFASGQGASGSPVFRGNEVIAVVFAGPADEANAGRNITTASFSSWLTDVIAANS